MENLPDIKQIVFALWRRKWLLLTVTLTPTVLGYFAIASLPAKYLASASLLVEKQELRLANFEDALAGTRLSQEVVQTEIGVIRSRALALKTIEDAGLLSEPEFAGDEALESGKDASEASKQFYVDKFMKNLQVNAQGESHVVNVGYLSQSPELASRVANIHTRNYIQYNKDSMAARAHSLYEWLSKQVAQLKEETRKKARQVQLYRAERGLVKGAGDEELIYQQISGASALLTPLETRKLELKARQDTIERVSEAGRHDAVSEVISSPLIQDLKAQEALAEQKLNMLRADFGPRHPKFLAAQNEVNEIRGKISHEIGLINQSTISELETVSQQEQLLNARLGELQKRADKNRSEQVVLATLENELQASRDALNKAMLRLEDVRAQASLSRSNADVIAWATPPVTPAEPNKLLLFAVVVVLSGGLGLLAVFIVEMFQNGFSSLQEVKKTTGRTPLGIIPYEKRITPNEMVVGYSIYSDAIKKIYMYGLMRKIKSKGGQTVLISSAQPNEGKSTVVMSLAYYMATIGKKVLVVDTDINRPSLHTMAGIGLRRGFSDLVTGNANPREVIHRDSKDKFDIITAGNAKMLSPELWQSERNQRLIQALREEYDFVLFDSPPLLALTDAAALSALMDETIIVAQWAKTSKKKVTHIIEQIEALSKPILGVVLTKVKIHQYATYDYGDAGIYYGANAKYYAVK